MVEFVKGKALLGPALTLIGGIFSLFVAVYGIMDPAIMGLFETNATIILPQVASLIFGIIILVGGYLAAKGNMNGNYISIILGLIVIVLWLFVLQPPPAPINEIHYYLVGVGPILYLIGGILGVVIKE
ncbi:MAG: hypothetical protein ACW985_06205 [Candidatus Thorarchaeota archaeon]|jgi:hypothetical protein